jgi:predicted ATPase
MDVRQSVIVNLTEKVKRKRYEKYLCKIKIVKAGSLQNQEINFDFPVTAIIGTNVGGKSTVLGAAALSYKSMKPGDFFSKIQRWRSEHERLAYRVRDY